MLGSASRVGRLSSSRTRLTAFSLFGMCATRQRVVGQVGQVGVRSLHSMKVTGVILDLCITQMEVSLSKTLPQP